MFWRVSFAFRVCTKSLKLVFATVPFDFFCIPCLYLNFENDRSQVSVGQFCILCPYVKFENGPNRVLYPLSVLKFYERSG